MSVEEAEALMKARYPAGDIEKMESWMRAKDVSSVRFPTALYMWKREKEEMNVLFTSPSSGSQVFRVSRRTSYPQDERPDFDKTVEALIQKYGKPSDTDFHEPRESMLRNQGYKSATLMWYLGGAGQCDLKHLNTGMNDVASEICRKASVETGPDINNAVYTPRKANLYTGAAKGGSDLIIVADVYSYDGSPRVARMTVSFTDVKRVAATVEADVKLLSAEQSKYDKIKIAAPEL